MRPHPALEWAHHYVPDPLRMMHASLFLPRDPERFAWAREYEAPGFRPVHLLECWLDLATASVVLAVLWFAALWVCNRVSRRFAAVDPAHKRMYVVANVSKTLVLGGMAVSHTWWFHGMTACIFDDWTGFGEVDDLFMKRTVVVYLVTDVVALFAVSKLPRTTIVHHVTAFALCSIVFAVDLDVRGWGSGLGVAKMIQVYGLFSTLAYLTNGYLALRVVFHAGETFMDTLATTAYWTYLASLVCNWGFHAVWFARVFASGLGNWLTAVYLAAIVLVGRDDIILIKWLRARESRVKRAAD
jgi:hypothetical protein